MQNFESLQRQNDEQGDIIEEQKKKLFTLKKDLEVGSKGTIWMRVFSMCTPSQASVTSYTETKEKLAETEAALSRWKSEATEAASSRDALSLEAKERQSELETKEKVGETENYEVAKGIHSGYGDFFIGAVRTAQV